MSAERTLSELPSKGLGSALTLAVLTTAFGICGSACAEGPQARLMFTGDVLLAREVPREITLRRGESPWSGMTGFFKRADWLMGNLEGSVGVPANCVLKGASPCFAIEPSVLKYLRDAGFTAMGAENNHSADLGADGRVATRDALEQFEIAANDFEHSPGFVKINGFIFAFVALSNVPGEDDAKGELSNELRQKIRLAKSMADWVVVNVHWGKELADWPDDEQRDMAKWMVEQGADVIIGHHPHVMQPPECILGKPVFFSLGNHVFDQKYAETKRGLIAECTIRANRLRCFEIETRTPMTSSFPEISMESSGAQHKIESCSVVKRDPLMVGGYAIRPRLGERQFADGGIVLEGTKGRAGKWDTVAKRLLSIEEGRLTGSSDQRDFLFTLERHYSTIDQEMSPRPYVYEVSAKGLVARWRGSALAWPLVDGKLVRNGDTDYLCALHRKDSFVELAPGLKGTRTAVYQWNGFGFSVVNTPDVVAACGRVFM